VLLLGRSGVYVRARCSAGCRATAHGRRAADRLPAAQDVEDKLNRLPLRYFDRQPRGELLSRVTNDIDNIAPDAAADAEPAAHLAADVVGVLVMMFSSSRRCWR
jgi:ABC-type multidrug transport system fused ATPase/permease subunit